MTYNWLLGVLSAAVTAGGAILLQTLSQSSS
jgi:hypothetical protein